MRGWKDTGRGRAAIEAAWPGETPGALNDRIFADYNLTRLEFTEHPEIKGLVIDVIAVDPDHRRQGRARAAMREILAWADRSGTTLYLTPDASMDPTVSRGGLDRFYRSLGFVKRPSGHGDFQVRELLMREPRRNTNPAALRRALMRL